ncbi:hypothetical protein RHSIM_Rhsim03G0040800 [Rhododendron simsii]|uniref:Uncharacterized protein n=1 Tax=Rhododendron simsii TaxID=118357 RepID=A0A834LRY3_RHOSS|nr:hypothetical protein RHSIM_Rhsim03G0040800 [Rhododendron simsii]
MVAAYPSNYLLLLLLLLLVIVVATASVAQATITIAGIEVSGVIVDGVSAYPANPTISVAGVNMSLSCDGGATTIGTRTLTGPIGAFKVGATTGNESKCAIYASPPVLSSELIVDLSVKLFGSELLVLEGQKVELVNGQIQVSEEAGSSIAAYTVAGPFVRVA